MFKVFLPLILTMAVFIGSGDIIYACVTDGTGAVRIVPSGTTCDANETALEWGVVGLQGPQGDPGSKGDTGDTGPKGDTGSQGIPGDAARADPPCFDNVNRYVDCGNGTVHDTVTGLIWMKNANCFTFLGPTFNYHAANLLATTIVKHGECGLTDNSSPGEWRLPTLTEWRETFEIADFENCTGPILIDRTGYECYATGSQQFSDVQLNYYWASNSFSFDPDKGRVANLNTGGLRAEEKGNTHYVWPVRGGK